MDYLKYLEMKKESEGIECFFSSFNSEEHIISDYKIICIMPNGECLFFPFCNKDNRSRIKNNYGHKQYLLIALEQILKKMKIDVKEYIQWDLLVIGELEASDLVYSFLDNLGVSILYDIGQDSDDIRLTNFEKSKIFTVEQRDCINLMRKPLEKEAYKIAAIEFIADDEDMKLLGYEYTGSTTGMFHIGANKIPSIIYNYDEFEVLELKVFYEIIHSIKLSKNHFNNEMVNLPPKINNGDDIEL